VTCIVGIAHQGKVYMGGDSVGSTDWLSMTLAQPKVFRNGDFIIGYTTSLRMGQLLQYKFSPPPMTEDLMNYMVTDFIDALRACVNTSGFGRIKENQESSGTFLVGYKHRLFRIEDYYSIIETDEYQACGSGEQLALGSLHTTQREEPFTRIKKALFAAEAHNPNVRGPFHMEMT
jgi:ATP-dependent protease HslVU (ClpYQ) peptidase subunit